MFPLTRATHFGIPVFGATATGLGVSFWDGGGGQKMREPPGRPKTVQPLCLSDTDARLGPTQEIGAHPIFCCKLPLARAFQPRGDPSFFGLGAKGNRKETSTTPMLNMAPSPLGFCIDKARLGPACAVRLVLRHSCTLWGILEEDWNHCPIGLKVVLGLPYIPEYCP